MRRKRWSGRFKSQMDPEALRFGASIPFDHKLAPYDIQGSIAYTKALARARLLTGAESRRIQEGLNRVAKDLAAGRIPYQTELEDIHTHVERALIDRIGEVGGKLHTGRSRNDQVATDLRLYCLDQLKQLRRALRGLQKVLVSKARVWQKVRVPGYTHLQRAQPVLLAHHFLAYVEMLERDEERFAAALKSTSVLPLGSGALAGNAFRIDRRALAKDLGFAAVSHNSLDAVSDRDFAVEILAAGSLLMVHLSRLSEELILWSTEEFGFLKLPEAFCTGSSMMPQKVNPDIPELIRGKSGRVIGQLMALLTVLKGLPLAYNKDLQEDKEPLFDFFANVLPALTVLAEMLKECRIDKARINVAADDPAMLATDMADWLVMKGVPFREGHEIAGRAVKLAIQKGVSLAALSLSQLQRLSSVFTKDIYHALQSEQSIAKRRVVGGTAPANVLQEIRRHQKRLAKRVK